MLLNYLRDIVKYTTKLGINSIRITGDNGNVTIEGSDETNKSVVIKGKFLKPFDDFDGLCGLDNLEWLSNYTNAYKHNNDVATIVRIDKPISQHIVDDDNNIVIDENGEPKMETVTKNIIEEIHFARGSQMKNQYRVMDTRLLPDEPTFSGLPWNVVIEPTKQAIDLLSTQVGFGVENLFGIEIEDDTLYLSFGLTGNIEFAYDVEGEIKKPWKWETTKILDILKLSSDAECIMSFSDKGALQITLNTGLSEYNYIIPAKANS